MRREKYVFTTWIAALALSLAGCGGSSSTQTQNPTTGLTKRVLITNSVSGTVQMIDALHDAFAKSVLSTTPTRIVTNGGTTVVLDSGFSQISMFDNTQETFISTGALLNPASDVAVSTDGKTAYAAVRSSGQVELFTVATGNFITTIAVPSATRMVMGPKGHKLLVFADDPEHLSVNADSFFVIDTAANTVTAIAGPVGAQPYTAVFDPSDANDTTAFILFCGTECAGSAAPRVAKVNFATPATPTVTFATGTINGATVGLLSGSTLFVAGSAIPPAGCTLAACGSVQGINTSTLTAGAPVPITDGLHTQMAITNNAHLYVGASSCTPGTVSPTNQIRGCLSIFNTGAGISSTNPSFPTESSFRTTLNVTGLQPISGRNVIYVIQGGELDIFDFTTDALTSHQLDVIGRAEGIVLIDP